MPFLLIKKDLLIEEILYYASLYFGYEKIYNCKKHNLDVIDFEKWKIEKNMINIRCKYINKNGQCEIYEYRKNMSNIIRKIYLPFICDKNKIKKIIKKIIKQENLIAFTTNKLHNIQQFDQIKINIGYIQFQCRVLKQITYNGNENVKQNILAQIEREKRLKI